MIPQRKIKAIRNSRFYLISVSASILIVVGCAAPKDNSNGLKSVIDSIDPVNTAIVASPRDSIVPPIDSSLQARQDSPKKSERELREERKAAHPPRTFVNIGAPDDRLPSIKNYEESPDGKAFFDLIRREWGKGSRKGVFQVREDSVGGFRNEFSSGKRWLHLIPQTDIETLFGKPSSVGQNQLIYYMNDACLGRSGASAGGCEYLKVELTHDKLAKQVSIVKNPTKE